MKIKVLIFFIVAVSSGFRTWAIERQDSLETNIYENSKVYFRFGSSILEPNYRNNVKVLELLVDTANVILSDTIDVSRRIKLLGSSSPEGALVENIKLAEGRAKSVKLFILQNSRIPSSRILMVNNELQPINKDTSYRIIPKDSFPHMRACIIEYITEKQSISIAHTETKDLSSEIITLDSIIIDELTVKEPVINNTKTSKLIFGINSNLLYWAGISPELKFRRLIPNIALEAFLGNRCSVQLKGVYTFLDKKFTDNQTWGVSGITLEPRIWFNGNSGFTGLFTGLYGQYGDFDVKMKDLSNTQGYTGTFLAAGISLGYHFSISNAFGLEVGLGAGYRQARTNEYIYRETNHYYLEHTVTKSAFGLHQIGLSVTYRFAKNNN